MKDQSSFIITTMNSEVTILHAQYYTGISEGGDVVSVLSAVNTSVRILSLPFSETCNGCPALPQKLCTTSHRKQKQLIWEYMFSLSQHYYLGNYCHPWKLFLNLKYITKGRLRHQTEEIRYKLTFQLVLLKKNLSAYTIRYF